MENEFKMTIEKLQELFSLCDNCGDENKHEDNNLCFDCLQKEEEKEKTSMKSNEIASLCARAECSTLIRAMLGIPQDREHYMPYLNRTGYMMIDHQQYIKDMIARLQKNIVVNGSNWKDFEHRINKDIQYSAPEILGEKMCMHFQDFFSNCELTEDSNLSVYLKG